MDRIVSEWPPQDLLIGLAIQSIVRDQARILLVVLERTALAMVVPIQKLSVQLETNTLGLLSRSGKNNIEH